MMRIKTVRLLGNLESLKKILFIIISCIFTFISVISLGRASNLNLEAIEEKLKLAEEIQSMFRSSHGRTVDDNKESGHHQDHWLSAYPEPKAFGGIGEKMDKKAERKTPHSVFHDSNPEKLFLCALERDPKIFPQLKNMKAKSKKAFTIDLRNEKFHDVKKDMIEYHGSTHAALPCPIIQRAEKAVFVLYKTREGKHHVQTAYPVSENPKDEYMRREISAQLNNDEDPSNNPTQQVSTDNLSNKEEM